MKFILHNLRMIWSRFRSNVSGVCRDVVPL